MKPSFGGSIAIALVGLLFAMSGSRLGAQGLSDEELRKLDAMTAGASCAVNPISTDASNLLARDAQRVGANPPDKPLSDSARKLACENAQRDRREAQDIKSRALAEKTCGPQMAKLVDMMAVFMSDTKGEIDRNCP